MQRKEVTENINHCDAIANWPNTVNSLPTQSAPVLTKPVLHARRPFTSLKHFKSVPHWHPTGQPDTIHSKTFMQKSTDICSIAVCSPAERYAISRLYVLLSLILAHYGSRIYYIEFFWLSHSSP